MSFFNKTWLVFLLGMLTQGLFAQYQMPVYSVSSFQPAQSGTEVTQVIDGLWETTYHSEWSKTGIPDTLTFYFSSIVPEITNLRYIPRQEGLNGIWEIVDIYIATRQNPTVFTRVNSDPIVWPANSEPKSWDFPNPQEDPFAIKIAISKAYGTYSSCAEMEFYGSKPTRPDGSQDCVITLEGLKVAADIKLPISTNGSYASSYQPGENIEKSFDGSLSTLYHSNWNQAYSALPIELNYHFNALQAVDYFVYYPRKEGYNGFFGKTSIYYLDQETLDYVHIMDYDFEFNGLDTRVNFPTQISTHDIKIIIHTGEQGFVSCAEMEFYQIKESTDTEPHPYSDIFSSALYDQLLPQVSTLDIANMEPGFYQSLAACLLAESYDKATRSRAYSAYQSIGKLSDKLKTSRYDAYENPTGLLFEKGDTVVVMAEGIASIPIYLRVKDFANEDDADDYAYQLNNGLNVLVMRGAGLSYVSYYTDNPDDAPDIHLNIVNGTINGYYDIDRHTAVDWVNMMSRNTYKKIDLIGNYVHLNYDRLPLKVNTPFDARPLVMLYDSIVQWQRIQMGLYKYQHNTSNHMFGVSGTGGGWYAGGQGIHLDLTWGPASITNAMRLDIWGIPHEFGHINQIRPGLKWIGTTEVTNNVYAVWANYQLNREKVPYTRLEAESFATTGSPRRAMNRYNGILNELYQQETHIQETKEDYPFRVLIPFWQLQLYYQVAGACRDGLPLSYAENPPADDIDYAHWYGHVAEKVRNTDENGLDNGTLLLNFYKNTCDAVQEDLTDFFLRMGLLRPVDTEIDDYGKGQLTITKAQIEQAIQEVQAKYSNSPVSPVIHYISALTVNTYRQKAPLTGNNGEGFTINNGNADPYMEIDHQVWKNSVAFESYDNNGNLMQATLTGTGDLTNQKTLVPMLSGIASVFAIGFDGNKIQVWPQIVSTEDTPLLSDLKVIPTLVGDQEIIRLESKNIEGNCQLTIYNSAGQIVYRDKGDLQALNQNLTQKTFNNIGLYHILVRSQKGNHYVRFIKMK
ncbi:MAG: M60 family metallopeptidase [Chitinophagales bacterium]|nr:M60 family metallopeptidase [Chitinophagales bacterium]